MKITHFHPKKEFAARHNERHQIGKQQFTETHFKKPYVHTNMYVYVCKYICCMPRTVPYKSATLTK